MPTQFHKDDPVSARTNITPFRDELRVSTHIRSLRHLDSGTRYWADTGWRGTTVLFPLLLPPAAVPNAREDGLIAAHYTATAWPLLLMVRGLTVATAFDENCRIRAEARSKLGPLSRLRPTSHLRLCMSCMEAQRVRFGASWWQCSLNLPLVIACPIHREALRYVPIDEVIAKRMLPHDSVAERFMDAQFADVAAYSVATMIRRLAECAPLIDATEIELFIADERQAILNQDPRETARLLGGARLLTHERLGGSADVKGAAMTLDGDDDLRLALLASGLIRNGKSVEEFKNDMIPRPIAITSATVVTIEDALDGIGFTAMRSRYRALIDFCLRAASDRRSVISAPATALLGVYDIRTVRSLFADEALPSFTQGIREVDAALGLLALAASNPFLMPATRMKRKQLYESARSSRNDYSLDARLFAEQCNRSGPHFLRTLKMALLANDTVAHGTSV